MNASEPVITCGICFGTIESAVELKCGHNFCYKCVYDTLKMIEGAEGQSTVCALCGEVTEPIMNLEDLRNTELDNYIALLREGPNSKFMCQWCDLVPATVQCNQCAAAYCEDCATAVHKHSAKKKHTLAPLTDPPNSFLTRCTQPGHEEYKAEFFCTECKELCCAYCLRVGPHLSHANTDLESAAAEARRQLASEKPETDKAKRRVDATTEELRQVVSKYNSTFDEVSIAITEKFNGYRAQLQEMENEMHRRLHVLREGGDTMVMEARTDFLTKVNGLLAAMMKMESSDTDSKVLRNRMLLNAFMNNEFTPLTGKGFLLTEEKELLLPDLSVLLDLDLAEDAVCFGRDTVVHRGGGGGKHGGGRRSPNSAGRGNTMTDQPHRRSSTKSGVDRSPEQKKLSDKNRGAASRIEQPPYLSAIPNDSASDISVDGRRGGRGENGGKSGHSRSQNSDGRGGRDDPHDPRDRYAKDPGSRRKADRGGRDNRDADGYGGQDSSYPSPSSGDVVRRSHAREHREPTSTRSDTTPSNRDRGNRSSRTSKQRGEDRSRASSSAAPREPRRRGDRGDRDYYEDSLTKDKDRGGRERRRSGNDDRRHGADYDTLGKHNQQLSGEYSGAYDDSRNSNTRRSDKKRRCCPELDNPLRLTFPVDEDVEATCRSDGIQFRCIARGNATTQIGVRSKEMFRDVDRKYPEDRGLVSWRIRLDIISDVFVGVVEHGTAAGSSGFFWKPGCSHVIDGKLGHYTSAMRNLPLCSTGDIIGFLYDVREKTLRLYVNDEDYGIVVTDLPKDISACFILYPGETVTVLY